MTSLRDFAGFRGTTRKPVIGRLAVPPTENGDSASTISPKTPQSTTDSAASRVKERLAALRGATSSSAGLARRPGIAGPVPGIASRPEPAARKEGAPADLSSESEVLVFRCRGRGCRHSWMSGRGATSSEQICKNCGESVVGVLSKAGAALCQIHGAGEIVKVKLERSLGRGLAAVELEDKIKSFVRSEAKFVTRFFNEDGVRDYVAYRQGRGTKDAEGRDARQDVLLVNRMAFVVEALCKAEFDGTMRAGEADAKLQALLSGKFEFDVTEAPKREEDNDGRTLITAAVDFSIELDVEDKIADHADNRLQKLRAVMAEMDKQFLGRNVDEGKSTPTMHPRQLLARFITSLDWKRAFSSGTDREGHDRIRCMTCRFINADCGSDAGMSREVRQALRRLPSFVFCTKVVLACTDVGRKSWKDRASDLIEGIVQTQGSECCALVESSPEDKLQLMLFSRPEWLVTACDRIRALVADSSSRKSIDLLDPSRSIKNLQLLEPSPGSVPKCDAVTDTWGFLDFFAFAAKGATNTGGCLHRAEEKPTFDIWATALVREARSVFKAYCALDNMTSFLDFLRDFRHKGSAQAKPEPRPPRPVRSARVTATKSLSPSRSCSRKRSRSRKVRVARRSPSYRLSPEVSRKKQKRSRSKRRKPRSSS
eukprot:TRINITY_DN13269_c0_g1_i2.p1 TRINITY_DN13269_c0_g1~~TRINITY_DN13269_c0_g1_i2.p1  ORF type:complete len:654 (+),score=85.96 TRINITY_DN13269_c0_g1_i2:190-2151(+)